MGFQIVLSLFSSFVFASFASATAIPSAYRAPGHSYQEYMHLTPLFKAEGWGSSAEAVSQEFADEASLLKALDDSQMLENKDVEAIEAFKKVRDLRFLANRVDPTFPRRISWLYPDDGCFARAELGLKKFKEFGISGVKKIFVFGDLEVQTENSRNGSVTWWFHVVPVMKIGAQYYAIDPAVEPSRPLTVLEWIYRMSPTLDSVKISICDAATYDPGMSCTSSEPLAESEVLTHQNTYLGSEWYRMKELGRDPKKVLGENPPWLNQDMRPSRNLFRRNLN